MTALSDWESDKSDGTLPLTTAAGEFQYQHFIDWQTFQTWGAGLGKEGKGSWHIQIINSNGDVLFEQTVTITITVIFFGLGIIWYYYDDVGEAIDTSIIGGKTIGDKNPAWTYVVGNGVDDETGDLIPGGGSTAGDIIDAWWQSPVYKMNVPVGAKLHVITDNWGLGVQVRPEWQWRFVPEPLQIDSTFDRFGFMNSVSNHETLGGLQCRRTNSVKSAPVKCAVLDGDSPSIAVLGDGRVMMLKNDDGILNLYQSQDAMLTFQKTTTEMMQGSVEMPHLVALRGGGYLQLSKNGNQFDYLRIGPDGARSTGTMPGNVTYQELSASQNDTGGIWVINETGDIIATSVDSGRTFQTPTP